MAGSPIRRILVAVDFSSCSGDALRLARALAAPLGASLEVVHVIEPATRKLGGGASEATGDPGAARDRLHQFLASAGGGDGAPATERVESGDVRERIVSIAEQDGFDLIVMGTHGRTGRPHAFVGSVAESVVRTSARPVLTVREVAR
jgi:nucleotide-binding universal stress UspA family protein